MRSAIAGVVGGLSGGATVLAAVVILSGQGRAQPTPRLHREHGGSFSAPSPSTDESLADSAAVTAASPQRPVVDEVAGVQREPSVETAWVMPKALMDAVETEGWRAYARPSGQDDRPIAASARDVPEPDPVPAARSAPALVSGESAAPNGHPVDVAAPSTAEIADHTPAPSSASGHELVASRSESVTATSSPVQATASASGAVAELATSESPLPEAAVAAVTIPLPAPAPSSAAPAAAKSAVREPEELRALRSFRLNVPKELPKVELFDPPVASAPASPASARSARAPQPAASSRGTTIAQRRPPSRAVASSPVPSASAPTAAAPTAAETAAASGQQSLKRASDAVKRLSRRMGGGYVR